MSFMQPEVVFGYWYEVDGPMGTEFIPADVAGSVTTDGKTRPLSVDELMGLDETVDTDSVRFPIPSPLKDYCENREAWELKLIQGYGARLSAPGYMDCTDWSVFPTEAEAQAYLREMEDDDE